MKKNPNDYLFLVIRNFFLLRVRKQNRLGTPALEISEISSRIVTFYCSRRYLLKHFFVRDDAKQLPAFKNILSLKTGTI